MRAQLVKWAPFALIVSVIVAIDQISKAWVIENLAMGETMLVIPALHPYFQFTRSFNTGIAFGLGEDYSQLFLILILVIILVLLWIYARSSDDETITRICLSMVIGGALGNVIDRVQHGHVVDFIHLRIPDLFSNVSNLADHAIVIGVGVLLIYSILSERRERQQKSVGTDAGHDA